MGTPDFAVPSLEELIKNGHEVIGVFTQQDKKKGRGQQLCAPPIKNLALKYNLKVFQPQSLKNDETFSVIKELNPELIVVVAYGKILPENILNIPKYGCINVHGSLLPEYRGAAPIQWAVIEGKKKTGVTTMFMDKGLDTGNMLLKKEADIYENDTAGSLYERLSKVGAELLIETIEKLEKNELVPEKQDDSKATFSSMLTKEMARIDWSKSAKSIHNLVRGLIPWPIARTELSGKTLKIYKTKVIENSFGEAGEIKSINPFIVCCGEGTALEIIELQFDNKRRMTAEEFFRGYKIKENALKLI